MRVSVTICLLSTVLGTGIARGDCRTVACDCDRDAVNPLAVAEVDSTWRDRHPDRVRERLESLEVQGRWLEAAEQIVATFLGASDSVDIGVRDRMLSALEGRLIAPVRRAEFRKPEDRDVLPAPEFQPRIDAEDDQTIATLFPNDKKHEIRVTRDMAPDARRVLCWTSIAAQQLLWRMGQPARERFAVDLHGRVHRWDNYVERGFKPTPLELLANGLMQLSDHSLEPPWWQLVLIHPSLGAEVDVAGAGPWHSRSWKRADVAAVELVGGILYNEPRTQYYGLSWTATYPADEGIGWGVTAHVGRWVSGGPIWREGKSPTYLVSLDLYGWFADVPRVIETARQRARDNLASIARRSP